MKNILLLILTIVLYLPCYAQPVLDDVTLPGFLFEDTDPGAPYGKGIAPQVSPVIAEIDGDTSNGKEVAIVTKTAEMIVMNSQGEVLWTASLPNKACDKSGPKAGSSPAVGKLAGDDIPYIVVGYGNFGETCAGGVIAYHGATGEVFFDRNLNKYDKKRKRKEYGVPLERLHTVMTTPALADVNNDGTLEIGFGSWDRHIYMLNHQGKVLWHYQAADTVWASPAFADIDEDDDLEMIVATDISENKNIKPPTKNGGYIYAFKTNLNETFKKKKNLLVRFRNKNAFIWKKKSNQTFFSSPVVADVHPNFGGKEIIIGSGYYFPEGSSDKKGAWVRVLDKKTGGKIAQIPMESCTSSSIAVGDLNFDGINEIVTLVNAYAPFGGDGKMYLSVWKASLNEEKFELVWKNELPGQNAYNYFSSPIVADLDGNGSLEVVIANDARIRIFNGASGEELPEIDNTDLPDLRTKFGLNSTPAIGDLNNDGVLDLVFPTKLSNASGKKGALAAFTNFSLWLESAAPADPEAPAYAAPWPQWRGDPQKTGAYK